MAQERQNLREAIKKCKSRKKIRLKTLQIRGARQTKPQTYNIKPKGSDNKKIVQADKDVIRVYVE